MKKQETVSVIIPNYNRRDDILESLRSICSQEYKYFEVIVVDDNSKDGSVAAISQQYPDVKIIGLDNNVGPARARNMGIREAKGDIIVGIDSDITFSEIDDLQKIVFKLNESKNISGLAFRILKYHDKTDDVERWWHPLPIEEYKSREFYTNYFSGSGYAFKKEVFDKAGFFPEEVFMYNEEVDLILRILDNGFDILYYPAIVVYHKASETARVNYLLHLRRNQLWMVVKYYPFVKGFFFIAPRLIKSIFTTAREKMLIMYLKSVFQGFKALPRELKLREPIKRTTWKKINLIKRGIYIPTSFKT